MLAEAWPQSSFREHVAKYDCFKQSIVRDADICVARGGLGPRLSYCNVPRIRVTRNCGAITRNKTTPATNAIDSLERSFCARDKLERGSARWVWKITCKMM